MIVRARGLPPARSVARRAGPALLALMVACAEGRATYEPVAPSPEVFTGEAHLGASPEDPTGAPWAEVDRADDGSPLPVRFDLLRDQSPVRDQGVRGTCSPFAVLGLIESVARSRARLELDLSESHAFWLAKFRDEDSVDLDESDRFRLWNALVRYGVVEESAWPYVARPWTEVEDPICMGPRVYSRCATLGEPPAPVASARAFRPPPLVRVERGKIREHIRATRAGVIGTLEIHRQAFNRTRNELAAPPNPGAGIFTTPNDADIAQGSDGRHAVVIVGWDDERTAPRIGADGKPITQGGSVVMERGFYLFRNSWGADWAPANDRAPGYGWISYDYVNRFSPDSFSGVAESGAGALGPPTAQVEACGNAADDDADGKIDCDDSECAARAVCFQGEIISYLAAQPVSIPSGPGTSALEHRFRIGDARTILAARARYELIHPRTEHLEIRLSAPSGGDVRLLARNEIKGDASRYTFSSSFTHFSSLPAAGEWKLRVHDDSASPVESSLKSFTLDIVVRRARSVPAVTPIIDAGTPSVDARAPRSDASDTNRADANLPNARAIDAGRDG